MALPVRCRTTDTSVMPACRRNPHACTSAPRIAVAGRGTPDPDPLPAPARRSFDHPAAARAPGVAPALLGEPVADPYAGFSPGPAGATVRCNACAHRCTIRVGRRGICGVRENRNGQLVTLVYGEIVAAGVEPIEKKPLFHVLPGTDAFSIATAGCNFRCLFCQNWEIAQAARESLRPFAETVEPGEIVRRAVASGSRSIAYTYVEPTVFLEYALDTARLAHAAGLANVFVTNGYQTPEALEIMAGVIDAANVDLKGFDERFYRRVAGARLAHVLEALAGMRRLGIWIEVTTLVIPGLNDDVRALSRAAAWIARELGPETPWHLSRFYPAYRLTDVPPTPLPALLAAAAAGREAGLRHVYVGNVDECGGDTSCTTCGRVVIARTGHRVDGSGLRDGRCVACGTPLAGFRLAG
jgi:pyruvate formate lyase activating enzyme